MIDELAVKPIIEVKNLNVTYLLGRSNEVRALQNINLEIFEGEFIIFFGPSGCGKSTLLYAISGLETHVRGTITVSGRNVATMTQKEIAQYRQKEIGMIFQAFYLIPTLSVFKNVELPQLAVGADKKSRSAKAEELLKHFRVDSQKHKLPTELSGGQQQRVAICRSLVNDPRIVMADEPVGNLDSQSSQDVMSLINELNEKQKKTVILVTHDPSHLHLAHRVFYIRDGKIIETKINRAITPTVLQPEKVRPSISKELELLIRTYSSIQPGQLGTLLIPFKAKEIVAAALTKFSHEEIEQLEKQVQRILISSMEKEEYLKEFLDKPEIEGGLELDERTAGHIAKNIFDTIKEIKQLQLIEKSQSEQARALEVSQIGEFITKEFKIVFKDNRSLPFFEEGLLKRLSNQIDKGEFEKLLDLPPENRGVGLDRRTARKVARYVELLMLGKFNG